MAEGIYGEVQGFPPGSSWMSRKEVGQAGVHRPWIAGICGTGALGAESIVLNDGYEDDQDFGNEIRYTGHGGQDNKKKQIADQDYEDSGNAALVTSQLNGFPVRIIRGSKGDPRFSPISGFR
jgi:putative restriction endonuclease